MSLLCEIFKAIRIILLGSIIGLLFLSYDAKAIDVDKTPFDAHIVGSINPFNALFTAYGISVTKKPLYNIYINSGGGVVVFGEQIVRQIYLARERGVIVNCYVGDIAASMAFSILQSCSGRFVNINSRLMQHHAYYIDECLNSKVVMRDDSFDMMRIASELKRIKLDYRSYLEHFIDPERFFGALEALSIGAVDEIIF